MAKKGALAVAYIYPLLLATLGAGSFALAYFYLMDWLPCGPTRAVGCLNRATYFGFEGLIHALLALLAVRAVGRARSGKDMWTMRTYWPMVLGLFAVVSLVAYLLAITPSRGCEVAAWYVFYGCWDPGVTALRVTLALIATGLFTFGMALWAGTTAAAAETPRDESPDEAAPEQPEEEEEEILP